MGSQETCWAGPSPGNLCCGRRTVSPCIKHNGVRWVPFYQESEKFKLVRVKKKNPSPQIILSSGKQNLIIHSLFNKCNMLDNLMETLKKGNM